MEYVNKKWDLPAMEMIMKNLSKYVPEEIIQWTIDMYLRQTDNRLDALYLAYYSLKDSYCKIKRKTFGIPKSVEYEPKKNEESITWYTASPRDYTWSANDYTWDVITDNTYTINGTYSVSYATNTATTTGTYAYATDDGWRIINR